MEVESLVVDAFAHLGIETRLGRSAPDRGIDLIVDPEGAEVPVEVKYRSLVTDKDVNRLLARPKDSAAVLLVVGDRVTESARRLLTSRHAGYYDLRGRLALHSDRMVIDVEVEPVTGREGRAQALSGKAGREVATWMLAHPQHEVAVRQLARDLKRSASTVSEVLTALRRDGMVDERNALVDTRLFWAVADVWKNRRTYLAQLPPPGDATAKALRLGLEVVKDEPGWALTESAAAAAYGAPVAVRSGQLLDFYVPDQVLVRRSITLLGAAESPAGARCTVRIAPVPAVCSQRIDPDVNPTEWPLAHPLFVALDLAQDVGRGREILDAWTPPEPWTRVW